MRLIDADKVNETIDRFIGYLDEDMILRIKMKISKIPTVDRPHGEWVKGEQERVSFFVRKCSQCGENVAVGNYCMWCGSDNRVEGDESE